LIFPVAIIVALVGPMGLNTWVKIRRAERQGLA
jgi:hypothetical protein